MPSTDHAASPVERLTRLDATLNLVFHDIATTDEHVCSVYDVTLDTLRAITDWCAAEGLARRVRLYFDDNHRSLYDLVLPRLDLTGFAEVVAAVPVTTIGADRHGGEADIRVATAGGFRVAAHGFSHIRLAAYTGDGALLPTPPGGRYADRSGHDAHQPLTENEVAFQLVEAKDHLDRLTGGCEEFVLPHGCYNATTLALNQRLGLFTQLATTDPGPDIGQLLRPRLTVTSVDTVTVLARRITEEVVPPCPLLR